MAYRRPAIEVIQEFQNAAAALALPTLPAVIVGPGFEIQDDVNTGVYSGTGATYGFTGSAAGSIVDLDNAPTADDAANVHKSIGVTLKNLFITKIPISGSSPTTGVLDQDGSNVKNLFKDATSSQFATIDPTAVNAPTFYVDVVSGSGVDTADLGRKLIVSKTDNNTLVVATEWQTSALPHTTVTYRILEFRASEVYPEATFTAHGITKGAAGVHLPSTLLTETDDTQLRVIEADVYLSWRGLRPDLAGVLTAFTDTDSLKAVFGTNGIVPANIGAFAVNMALQNTTTPVSFTGLNSDFFDNEELSYTAAFDFLESKDVYALAILTQNTAVHQLAKAHVEAMSLSTVGRERVCFVNRQLSTFAVITPASGLGTSSGGALSGATFLTFRDADATFITDHVGVGQFLEVVSYVATPVAPVITQFGSAGAVAATYKVVAVDAAGNQTAASAVGSTSTGNATLSGSNYNIVTWTAVPGAVTYKIYRITGYATQGLIGSVAAPLVTYNDQIGSGGDSTTPPTTGILPAAFNTYLTGTRHQIASVNSNAQVTLAADPTNGSGGVTIGTVVYRVTRDLSRTEEAQLIAGYSTSLGSRRVVATWPDILAVSVNATATKVPGYFLGPVLAGMTSGLPSQAGFTNLSLVGFVGREDSDDRYSDTQLDIIAGGGTFIVTQPVPEAALLVRHQLTTDVSTIFFQEFSVTKNVDLIARYFRDLFRPYIGNWNIQIGLMDALKTRAEGGIKFLLGKRAPRLGAPIRKATLMSIAESTTQPDSVEVEIDIDVPLPLNNITLTLLV